MRTHETRTEGVLDCTGALTVLATKLSAVAYNYQDGLTLLKEKYEGAQAKDEKERKELTEEQRRREERMERSRLERRNAALVTMPSVLELMGYLFCFGLHITGPFFEFKVYNDWTRRQGIWSPGFKQAPILPPFCRAFIQGVLAAAVFLLVSPSLDLTRISDLRKNRSFPFHLRWLYAHHAGVVWRFRTYILWSITEAAMIVGRLGFSGWEAPNGETGKGGDMKGNGGESEGGKGNGKGGGDGDVGKHEGDKTRAAPAGEGKALWNRARNADMLGVEFPKSCLDFATTWNISYGLWLRLYVYKRMVPPGRRPTFVHMLATMLVSAVSHVRSPLPRLPCAFSLTPSPMCVLPYPVSHVRSPLPCLPCAFSLTPSPMCVLPYPVSHVRSPLPRLPCAFSLTPSPMCVLPYPVSHVRSPLPCLPCAFSLTPSPMCVLPYPVSHVRSPLPRLPSASLLLPMLLSPTCVTPICHVHGPQPQRWLELG
ncbi:unnamed protein product [Closterium sp. NIES-64]|nr:unnamed protein product [Closterium sp. NIES-64]